MHVSVHICNEHFLESFKVHYITCLHTVITYKLFSALHTYNKYLSVVVLIRFWFNKMIDYWAFTLTWPACIQIYWTKESVCKQNSSTPTGLVWDTNMAAVSLIWDTNMAAVTSCENTLYQVYSTETTIPYFLAKNYLCEANGDWL